MAEWIAPASPAGAGNGQHGKMRADFQNSVDAIGKSLELLTARIDRPAVERKLAEFNAMSEDPGFWSDRNRAQAVMRRRQSLADSLEMLDSLQGEFDDIIALIELAESEADEELLEEVVSTLDELQARAGKMELEALLSGEADANDAFLEINAGAGGTESCDWAMMLARMYEKWARRRGYEIETIAANRDGEAGYKSVTMKVIGKHAFGWLKSESGVHRLVRNSPFDSNSRRHTSFSSVTVYPVVDDSIEIEINPADLRVDTFRASGAGGQHVNKTDSAVRLTHIPSGIVVTSSEKSQHQNRAICLAALRSKLYEIELNRRNEQMQEIHSQKGDAGWGNQIRSYVLTPYRLVKDLRTQIETSDTQAVLDGDLDEFMASVLARNATGRAGNK